MRGEDLGEMDFQEKEENSLPLLLQTFSPSFSSFWPERFGLVLQLLSPEIPKVREERV